MKDLTLRSVKRFLAVFLLAFAFAGCSAKIDPADLPQTQPPVLNGFEPAVIEQVQAAYAKWETNPLSANANGDLAMLLHTYLQYATASNYYQRARLLDPNEFRWAYLHGLVLTKQGERDQAIEAMQAALQLDPAYAPAMLNLAQALADAGEDAESHSLYAALLRLNPNLPQALYGQGKGLLKQGDRAGIELLERALLSKGPYGEAHYALAEAYRSGGETDKAEKQLELFEKFRTVTPSIADPLVTELQFLNYSKQGLINRGQLKILQGKIRPAIDDFELALSRDPSMPSLHSLLVTTYGMINDFGKAESHYEQGLALDPENAKLHNNFGVLRLKQRRYDEAGEAFQEAIAANPDYLDAYVNLGAALESSGKRSEAIKYYKIAVERDPFHRAAAYHLGNAYMRMRNPYKAVEQFSRILEPQDRNTADYLQALASAYSQMHQKDNANETLQRAIRVAEITGRTDLLPALQSALKLLDSPDKPSMLNVQ